MNSNCKLKELNNSLISELSLINYSAKTNFDKKHEKNILS